MARIPTIDVAFRALDQSLESAITRLSINLGGANVRLRQLNAGLATTSQTMNTTAGSVFRGIGAFFIFRRGMEALSGAMRYGIDSAAEQSEALNVLGAQIGLGRSQLDQLRVAAEDTATALGRLTSINVIDNMRQLMQMPGGENMGNVLQVQRLFSTIVNDIVALSRGKVSPESAMGIMRQLLFVEGGITDPEQAGRVLRAQFRVIAAFAADNPRQLLSTYLPIAAVGKAVGLSVSDRALLAAIEMQLPTSSRVTGRPAARLLEQLMLRAKHVGGRRGQTAYREAVAAGTELGLMQGGHPLYFRPGTDTPDFLRLISLFSASPSRGLDRPTLINDFKRFLGTEAPVAFALAIAENADIRAALSRLKSVEDPEQMSQRLLGGFRGATTLLGTTLKDLAIESFRDLDKGMSPFIHRIANRVARERGRFMSGPGAADLRALGSRTTILGIGAGGLFGAGALAGWQGLTALSSSLFAAAQIAALGAGLGSLVLLGISYYSANYERLHADTLARAIRNVVADAVNRFIGNPLNIPRAWWDIFHGRDPFATGSATTNLLYPMPSHGGTDPTLGLGRSPEPPPSGTRTRGLVNTSHNPRTNRQVLDALFARLGEFASDSALAHPYGNTVPFGNR